MSFRQRVRTPPRAVVAAVAVLGFVALAVAATVIRRGGPAPLPQPPQGPSVVARFAERSYAPGDNARLLVETPARSVRIRVYHAGAGRSRTPRDDVMLGAAVNAERNYVRPRSVRVRIRDWPSGLYFARLTAPDGRVGFAPFVLRPARLGEHRVAVVLPTNTWAAYNFRDADRDGVGDTWYASPDVHWVDLARPFLNRGVPPHYRGYDAGFIHWAASTHHDADYLSDEDLDGVRSGDQLARRYDLIVFSGHEEYVTTHTFDIVERFRDLGGNLAFLSANNFFYRVEREGHRLHGRDRFRDLGRPEATLIGSQYVDWYQNRYLNRPYTVVGAEKVPWLVRGTGLHDGSRFGLYGIEVDARTRDSPPGTMLISRIRDIFGPGKSAEMTYYETPRGAKVFAAGVMNFGGTAWFRVQARMIANLWARLARRDTS